MILTASSRGAQATAATPQLLHVLVLMFACLLPHPSDAQEANSAKRYIQAPAVLARFPDVPIVIDTPALRPGRTTFTSQSEMEAFIADLASAPRSAAHLMRLTLGTTPGGRNLPALLISKEGARTPAEMANLGRPIVWLIGQQHGDEPAGGEAMLALAQALSDGDLVPVLDSISVVVIPRANPDGAAAGTRVNAAGQDINRDHALFSQPEIRLIHALVRQLPPALVIDAHEFTVGRRWVEKLGGLQAVDLMVLSSTHPMTPAPIRALTDAMFQPAVEAAISSYKLTSFIYHTTSSRSADRSISVGGSAPGIARNAFGLMGAVSILLETRGVGIGLESYQRRVATHVIAAKALLEAAATHAELLAATNRAAQAVNASPIQDVVVAHTNVHTVVSLPLIDPLTGADKVASVTMLDTRIVTGTEQRSRPAGYLISADRIVAIRAQIKLLGADICQLTRAAMLPIESYDVLDRTAADRRAINPDASLRVRVHSNRRVFEAGSIFIGVDQAAGTRLMLALEPDAPGSLSAQTLLVDEDPGAIAIARLPREGLTPEFRQQLNCTK